MSIKSGFPQLPTPGQIGAEESIKDTTTKSAPADSDALVLADSSVAGKKKLWTFVRLKAWLETIFAAIKHGHEISDVAGLESTLSNKAATADHNLRTYTSLAQLGLSGAVTMEQVIEAIPNSSCALIQSSGPTTANYIVDTPGPSYYWQIKIDKSSANYVFCRAMRSNNAIEELAYEGRYHSLYTPKFQGWRSIATATKPQEYDLPLAAGVTRGKRCVYSKAQDSLVVVRFSAAFPATASRTQKIGTLPAGYRSSEATVGAGKITHTSGDTTTAAAVELWENGDITVYGNTTGFTSASGILVFYAS